MTSVNTYLALGDSYTIGEGVALSENFPYQAVQILRNTGRHFNAPEIVARTGWTTGELSAALNGTLLNSSYDFASLLIGVNNQYRGLAAADYSNEFSQLLDTARSLVSNSKRVIVLSIPDWSVTPFALDRDREKISSEITAFNIINRAAAATLRCTYLDITTGSPMSKIPSFTAADALHPSGKEYLRWAQMVAKAMLESL
jgi:lysophospholipase L1-like esterase